MAALETLDAQPDDHAGSHARPRMVLVAVGDLDRRALTAAHYAVGMRPDQCEAVHVAVDTLAAVELTKQWPASPLAALSLRTLPDLGGVGPTLAAAVADLLAAGYAEVVVAAGQLSMPRIRRYVLHDRTAAGIQRAVNRVPGAVTVLLPVPIDGRPPAR